MKKLISTALCLFLAATLSGCSLFPFAKVLNPDQAPEDIPGTTDATYELPDDYTTAPVAQAPVPTAAEVNIRPAEWASVQWQPYQNQYFTLQIPAGWQVEFNGDANQMQWQAYSPDKTVGFANIDHAYAAKDASMKDALGFGLSMQDGTVREFFEAMFSSTTEYFTVQNSCVPDNKAQLQSIRPNTPIHDYQSLYATFKDENVDGEGIYSAVVMDSRDVVFNGKNYGAWEVNCIFTQWAPKDELVNWAPVLAQIAKSFSYTEYYLQQWKQIAQDATNVPSTLNDPDPVMEAFEERSKSDTIIQEKRSDMLGEYERVYDNNTGEIYRAYNGFLDDMGDQNRYTPITDNQYTEGYKGWIDKP